MSKNLNSQQYKYGHHHIIINHPQNNLHHSLVKQYGNVDDPPIKKIVYLMKNRMLFI